MYTAEAASGEGNHKVVIQAIREGTRVIALILKMTSASDYCSDSLIDHGQSLAGIGGLDMPPAYSSHEPQSSNQALGTGNRLSKKWKKSGKIPEKKTFQEDNSEGNKNDSLLKKFSANFSPGTRKGELETLCVSNWLDDLASGRLDIDTLNAIGAGRPQPELLEVFKAEISL